MKRAFLFITLIFLFLGCNHVYRVEVEVMKPPRIKEKLTSIYLIVEEKSLKNDLVEIQDFKGQVEEFLKNELENQGHIKVLKGKGHPQLKVEYKAYLSRAYKVYRSDMFDKYSAAGSILQRGIDGSLVPVKVLNIELCFSIKKADYHRCIKEKMNFPEYESSVFALYAVLQRITSSFLADVSYQKIRMTHYLLR